MRWCTGMNFYKHDLLDLIAALAVSAGSDRREFDPLLRPAPGQFHPPAVETDMWEVFLLVLETNGDLCQVIPGSMDPFRGGPADLLIPAPENRSRHWTLNLELKQEIRMNMLLPGFAKLMPDQLDYVKSGLNRYERGEPLGSLYRFCLPYIGENDSRKEYRKRMENLIRTIRSACRIRPEPPAET